MRFVQQKFRTIYIFLNIMKFIYFFNEIERIVGETFGNYNFPIDLGPNGIRGCNFLPENWHNNHNKFALTRNRSTFPSC